MPPRKAKKDATKGGMLELCMEEYYAAVEPRIRRLLEDREKREAQAERIGRLIAEITASVVERGRGLHKGEEFIFSPRQHAVKKGIDLGKQTLLKNLLMADLLPEELLAKAADYSLEEVLALKKELNL